MKIASEGYEVLIFLIDGIVFIVIGSVLEPISPSSYVTYFLMVMYFLIPSMLFGGSTLAMRLLKVKVRRRNEKPVTKLFILVRSCTFIFIMNIMILVWFGRFFGAKKLAIDPLFGSDYVR